MQLTDAMNMTFVKVNFKFFDFFLCVADSFRVFRRCRELPERAKNLYRVVWIRSIRWPFNLFHLR